MKINKIPKIIWQTHEWEEAEIPYDYKMASLTWKNLNPEWEYRYVSAEKRREQVKDYDQNILNFYDKCSGISQSDIWRYIVLYQYGGVYSDMDSMCSMSLNNMLTHFPISKDVVCVPMSENFLITGTYAAKAKSNIFKYVIEEISYGDKILFDYGKDFHIGWENIAPAILKNKEYIDFLFLGVFHGGHLGGEFKYSSDFDVRINNNFYKYSDLAITNNWIY